MIRLTISKSNADLLASSLLGGETEQCAVLYASRAELSNDGMRLLVREIEFPGAETYSKQSRISAELNPAFVAKVSKKARIRGESLVFVHSHPGDEPPEFSSVDDEGEQLLAGFLSIRTPGTPHGAVVISAGGWCGRQLGTRQSMSIIALGEQRRVLFHSTGDCELQSAIFDRQIRAFGEAGQRAISSLTVAIIGLGGTGSVMAEQLSHLGVRKFVLVDPDELDVTNLNRVVGAYSRDVGRPKVDVAAVHISTVSPGSRIKSIRGDVTRTGVAKELIATDFIFSCTDSHGSRAVIQQIAYQYMIFCIDVGSVLTAAQGQVTGIHGRVQALGPDLPCLSCSGLIDAEEVRRDMMNDAERQSDPYIQGHREPAPSVISINSTVTSLAVTMFMAIVVGIPSEGRYVLYNAKQPSLRSVRASRNPNCYICSPSGVLARGDAQMLFTRDE